MPTPYSVLVIEDDPDIRQLLELLLRRDNRLALDRSFDNAADALTAVRDGGPEVILCDVGLPGMSGVEAVPHFRAVCPDAVIVMYTANLEAAFGAEVLGVDAVVSKDTAPARLFEKVLELIEQRMSSDRTSTTTASGSRWPAGHVGWTFERRDQFESAVTSFLADGAALGERLILVTDDPEPDLWPAELVDSGDLLILSTNEVYGENRLVDAATQRTTFQETLHEADRLGYHGLRVAADNTSLALGSERIDAWLRWETEADALMRNHAITGLCGFDRSRLDARSLEALISVHATQPG